MSTPWKLFGLGALAMLAFAGNSILNRFALSGGEAGAWSFTLIRLISGSIMLAFLSRFRVNGGSWISAMSLLIYAAGFSFAYLALDAGIGALILFTLVQFTMMGRGLTTGERFGRAQWLGALTAFAAMVWLLWPAQDQPETIVPIWAVASMAAAGVGWGIYSLIGRAEAAPLLSTTGNFARAALLGVVISVPVLSVMPEAFPSAQATAAAVASGAITSGIGYAIWYAALPGLSRMQAGVMQLSVPALAALGGVWLLSEPLTPRMTVSIALVLTGVGATMFLKRDDIRAD